MLEAMRRYANRTSGGVKIEGDQRAGDTSAVSFTGRVAGWTARHAWITLVTWLVVLVGAFLLAGSLNVTGEGGVETADSRRASALIEEATGAEPPAEEFVLVEANDGPIDEALFASVVGSIVAEMRALPIVESVTSFQDGAETLRTPDGRMALIQVTTTLAQDDDLAQIHRRDDYAAAERAIGAREGDGPGTIWGRGGPVSVFSCRGETL